MYNTKSAFPASKDFDKGLTKLEYAAIEFMKLPRSKEDIEFEIRIARNKNPHNDPHKPDIPSETEVRAKLAVDDAVALFKQLENRKYR